jgi:arylsulfatase A-like enzyme
MKKILNLLILSFGFLLVTTCQSPSTQNERKLPNILFIPVDDLRPELNAYGISGIHTPNIDRLAAQGMVFTRTYCQQAVCNPSRASLLTGLRPDSIRVWDLRKNFRDVVPDVVTLPQFFKEKGYHTVGIGKTFHNTLPDTLSWSEKPHIDGFPFDPDAVYVTEENIRLVEGKKQQYIEKGINRIDQLGHWYIKTVATEIADAEDDAYFDGAQTTLAINKLQEFSEMDKPFFLSVGYYRPHLPFNAPKKYWDLYDRNTIPLAENRTTPGNAPAYAMNLGYELRGYDDFKDLPLPEEGSLSAERERLLKHGYYASVSYIDAQLGRLLDALEEFDLAENTLVVLWGDHGWKLGEHNGWCKQTNYEIDTHVPLIFAGPGTGKAGSKYNGLTEFVDVYPTLVDLAGFELPDHLHGKSLVPAFSDLEATIKEAAFSQFLRGRFGRARKVYEGKEFMGYALRTDRYRYVEWYDWNPEMETSVRFREAELYDHETDPEENQNIVGDQRKIKLVETLSKKLKKQFPTIQ